MSDSRIGAAGTRGAGAALFLGAVILAGCLGTARPPVIPAKVGIPGGPEASYDLGLDSRLRGNDGEVFRGNDGEGPIEERAQPIDVSNTKAPIPLTRDGALLTALKNNRSVEVARFGPRIASTYEPEARAAFDPVLLGTVSTGHAARPATTVVGQTSQRSGGGGVPANNIEIVEQILTDAQALAAILDDSANAPEETDDTQGTLTIQETLPTGTMLYLTGEASGEDSSLTGHDYQGGWTVGVTQPLLEGAGTKVNLAALRQARNRAARSGAAFRGEVLAIAGWVELAYWELLLAHEVDKIRVFGVTLAEEQLKRNEALLRVGKAIEGDVLASRAERASRMADEADARAAIRRQDIALVRLLNPTEEDAWALAFDPRDAPEIVEVPVDPEASEALALRYRPVLTETALDLANLEIETAYVRNRLLPQLDLTASYGRISEGATRAGVGRHLDDSDYEDCRIGLEFRTPILNRAEKARYRRVRLTAGQMERSLRDLEQAVAAEVRQAAIEVQRQWDRIGATREALQSRTEQLRIAEGRNLAGKTTNLDLLIVQRDYIQAQVDEVTARVRYIQALTDLYAAEGTLLERRGILLEEAVGE